jgi:sulfur carrier protein ThiS
MIANKLTRAVNKNITITIIRKLNGELVNGKFKYEEIILDNISANKQPLTTDEKQALKELNDDGKIINNSEWYAFFINQDLSPANKILNKGADIIKTSEGLVYQIQNFGSWQESGWQKVYGSLIGVDDE